jgi:NitT/TauT family transport system permease protein
VVLRGALPELLNGIRTALALAFVLLVSSELIVARQGLGYLIGYLAPPEPTTECLRSF